MLPGLKWQVREAGLLHTVASCWRLLTSAQDVEATFVITSKRIVQDRAGCHSQVACPCPPGAVKGHAMNRVYQDVGSKCQHEWRVQENLTWGNPHLDACHARHSISERVACPHRRLVLHNYVPDAMTPSSDSLAKTSTLRSAAKRHHMLHQVKPMVPSSREARQLRARRMNAAWVGLAMASEWRVRVQIGVSSPVL